MENLEQISLYLRGKGIKTSIGIATLAKELGVSGVEGIIQTGMGDDTKLKPITDFLKKKSDFTQTVNKGKNAPGASDANWGALANILGVREEKLTYNPEAYQRLLAEEERKKKLASGEIKAETNQEMLDRLAKGAEANRVRDEAIYGVSQPNGTTEKTEAAKQQMWEQWNTMGPPKDYVPISNEPLPTGTGPLPMAEGEKEAMIKKYVDAGYTQAQAETAVGNLTSTRKSYETGNSIIDAILNQITPEQLAVADFKWNDTLQEEAKKMAEADFGPYYTRMYESEEASLKLGLEGYQTTYERDVQDTGLAKDQLRREYDDALTSARRSYASSGLAYSSERSGKESDLSGSLTRGLTAEDISLGRTKEDVEKAQQELMQKGELRLGSTTADKLKSQYQYESPLSERYSGELELEKRKAIAEDIQRQKSNYLQIYT